MSSVSGTSGDRNYMDILNGETNANKVYNAVIDTSGKESGINTEDFFKIMMTQLTNQDFLNPQSDTEYFSQMAEFYSMQAMKDLSSYTQQSYAASLVGKVVTASKYSIGGSVDKQTGVVEKVVMSKGEYEFFVNGKGYSMDQISQISVSEEAAADSDKTPDKQPDQKPDTEGTSDSSGKS